MLRSSICFVLVPLCLLACGGSAPPAATAESATASEPSAGSETGSEPGAGAAASDEAWEGEAEATSKQSGDAEGAPAPPDTKGEETRTTEVIAKVIQTNRQPFRDCYEKGKKELPGLRGNMTIHFVLDPEGNVKKAEFSPERSEIKSPIVVDCAIAYLKTLKFPPSSRGMESTINYPFNFNP